MNTSPEVDNYIARFSGTCRERLEQIRAVIHRIAPEASESISYGMPGYKLNGKPLVYFGGYSGHVGLYATPNGHAAFAKEFAPYKQGKGSVQFPHDQPLPIEIIEAAVRYRVTETLSETA
jgi:uncharacterized protein YdhG (YjbR/CyaY superfamily)